MLPPNIPTRVIESRKRACNRVDTSQVWPLVQIAVMTGERQIREIVRSLVLSCDNVFYVELEKRLRNLGQPAILAPRGGPADDDLASGGIHIKQSAGR